MTRFLARLMEAHYDKDMMLAVRSMQEALEEDTEYTDSFCALSVLRLYGSCYADKPYLLKQSSFQCQSALMTTFFKPSSLFSEPIFGLKKWKSGTEHFLKFSIKKAQVTNVKS